MNTLLPKSVNALMRGFLWLISGIYWVFFRLYRYLLSPMIHLLAGSGFGCRFHPTCSEYAVESVKHHGLWKGSLATLRRLGRCHPFSRAPLYDPVISRYDNF